MGQKPTIVDSMKQKALEFGTQYFKEKVETTKDDILKYVEKIIEEKIKKELRKLVFGLISLILLSFGLIFIIYSGFETLVYFLGLPDFFVNIFFGILLLLFSFIIYLTK